MKRLLTVAAVVVGIVFLGMQFVQPSRENPASDPALSMAAQMNIPPAIVSLLDRGCRDCHSNNTVWPVYAYIAPASWLVSHDVTEGRKHFNMSEWGRYKQSKRMQKLSGIYEAVTDRSMPMPKYVPLHPEAKFTDAERDSLARWAKGAAEQLMGGEQE